MLKRRILTAIVLLLLFGLELFLASTELFALVLSGIVAAGAWEWSRLSGVRHPDAQTGFAAAVGLIALVCLFLQLSDEFIRWVMLAGLVYWMGATTVLVLAPVRKAPRRVSTGLLMRGVIALVIAALAMQYLRSTAEYASPWLLLYSLLVVWFMDIGAYFVGRRYGRRKLAPLISPGKTWEGVYGGIGVTAVLVTVLAFTVDWPDDRELALICGSLAAAAASVVGDLAESRIKRAANMKDSSNLLPGHGGVLDRVDGVLAAMPLFAFFWVWL